MNARVYMKFDGVDEGGSDTHTALYANGSASAMHVSRVAVGGNGALILGETGAATATNYGLLDTNNATKNLVFIRDDANSTKLNSVGADVGTTPHAVCNTDTGTSVVKTTDAVEAAGASYTRTTLTPTKRQIGFYSTAFLNADVAEVVAFKGVLPPTQKANGQANQKGFYGTP